MRHKKIFTREEIGAMSHKKYAKHEKEIIEQLNTIGIPYAAKLTEEQKLQNQKAFEEKIQAEKNKHTFTREEIKAMSQKELWVRNQTATLRLIC